MPRRSVRFSPTTVCFHVFQTATLPSHSTSLPVLSVSAHHFIPSIPPATDIIHVHTGNSRLPQFSRTSSLNIYLYEASSNTIVAQWLDHPNPKDRAGVIRYQVNDTWWGDRGAGWDGQNRNFLYYWVATAPEADPKLQGIPQPIFTAVRK